MIFIFSISHVSKQTGFTTHTLRYYEKIGLLPPPIRDGGIRKYTSGDIRLLQFVKVLKNTGISLEDIKLFLLDGCILESNDVLIEKRKKVQKRINILQTHLRSLNQQRQEIEMVIELTKNKLSIYKTMLQDD